MDQDPNNPGKETRPDKIAADIRRQVATRLLAPGDALGTETVLARRYGVSRNVMREALARLRSDGVIETRRGRGPVVLPEEQRTSFRVDASALDRPESVAELFQLRHHLETMSARLAALHRTEEDVARLTRSFEMMRRRLHSVEDIFAADVAFHHAVGQASGNPYLSSLVCYLSARLIDRSRDKARSHPDESLLETTLDEHQPIYEAVMLGTPDEAEAAMREHIRLAAGRAGVTVVP